MKIGVMQSSYIDLFNMPICLHRRMQKIISREKERDQGKWVELRFTGVAGKGNAIILYNYGLTNSWRNYSDCKNKFTSFCTGSIHDWWIQYCQCKNRQLHFYQ